MGKCLKTYMILAVLTSYTSCKVIDQEEIENARYFRNAYTSTVVVSKVFTSYVPSSCVQVASTLPPCRHVRYMKFPALKDFPFYNSINDQIDSIKKEYSIATTPLAWGEYFGFFAPTVTVTETQLHTNTVQDPAVVVTFAVKGCRPLHLPDDIDRCTPDGSTATLQGAITATNADANDMLSTSIVETPVDQESSVLVTESLPNNASNDIADTSAKVGRKLLSTTVVHTRIKPTSVIKTTTVGPIKTTRINSLEASNGEIEENFQGGNIATEPLS